MYQCVNLFTTYQYDTFNINLVYHAPFKVAWFAVDSSPSVVWPMPEHARWNKLKLALLVSHIYSVCLVSYVHYLVSHTVASWHRLLWHVPSALLRCAYRNGPVDKCIA